jgi:uncharacterized PurR-regulated membrane protein YhhQ (DUF165 family)
MTYQSKMRYSKRRARIIVPIVFMLGIFVCSVVSGHMYDGLTIAQSLNKSTRIFLFIATAGIISTLFAYVCISIQRAIKLRLGKNRSKE